MSSPGSPSLRQEVERQFWVQIATGITSERAADAVGVSHAVGSRLSQWSQYFIAQSLRCCCHCARYAT